ncbi:hypothetical protein EDD15DRAFT_2520430 [Pisolithus albus]|nr:hypothetical protein EDD15DRAFT_2520430 [Pisolithus albus]
MSLSRSFEHLEASKRPVVRQEIPREIPGRTLKDRMDRWDPGNRPKDIRNPPSSPGRQPLEDVGRLEPQAHMVSLALSRTPRLSVHPTTPSERPLCAPLSMEGPSYPTQAPSASSSSSDVSLRRPRSPSHPLPTKHSRGRPQSRSRSRGRGRPHSPSRFNLENPPSRSSKYVDSYSGSGSHSRHSHSRDYHGRLHSPSCSQLEDPPSHSNKYMDSYSSGSYSRCSRSRDYHHRRSPPPAPQLASSHLPTLSRDESELEELTSPVAMHWHPREGRAAAVALPSPREGGTELISLRVCITPSPVNAISRPPLTHPSRKPGFELYSTRAFERCIFRRIQPSTSEDISRSLEKGFVGQKLGYLGIGRYTRRCECIPGSRVIRTFVFGQDSKVRFTYLARFPVEPLALLHGGTTCSRLPGDAIFMASRSFVAEIWVFSVYRGVRDSLADISGTGAPFSTIPRSPNSPRASLSPPGVSRASPRRHLPDDIRDVACTFAVAELFEFLSLNQGREVKITYRTHSRVEPLAFPHGGSTRLQLPGDTLFMGTRSWVPEIWEFVVYEGVRDDSADISRPDGPIGIVPFSPSRPRCPLPPPTVWYRLPQRSSLGGLFFSPTVVLYSLSTPYLPQISAMPLAFLGAHTTRSALLNGIPCVTIRAALVEKYGFSCGEESWAGFADISRRSARIGGYRSGVFPFSPSLLCCDVAYGISPSVLGRPSRFSGTWYYSMTAFSCFEFRHMSGLIAFEVKFPEFREFEFEFEKASSASLIYSANYCPSLSKSASSHDLEQCEDGPDGDDRDVMSDVDLQESDIVVPPPNNSTEAYLLLETARADRQVRLTRKNLALQIVHRNTLTLQYNRLILEKVQEELHSADRLVGHVCFIIRKSGIPVVSEYAMHEDHSVHLPSSVYNSVDCDSSVASPKSLDVKLDKNVTGLGLGKNQLISAVSAEAK